MIFLKRNYYLYRNLFGSISRSISYQSKILSVNLNSVETGKCRKRKMKNVEGRYKRIVGVRVRVSYQTISSYYLGYLLRNSRPSLFDSFFSTFLLSALFRWIRFLLLIYYIKFTYEVTFKIFFRRFQWLIYLFDS
jgi:hypothetical protein